MGKKAFFDYFPVPGYLNFPAVGFDVSDGAIKFVELLQNRHGLRVGKYGKVELNLSEKTKEGDKEWGDAVTKALVGIKKEHGFEYARVSLPEDQAYFIRTGVPKVKFAEVRGNIELQLEEYISYPPADVNFDYEIVGEDAESFKVAVSVMPISVVENYGAVFKNAGITPIVLEVESEASSRALVPSGGNESFMLVNLGMKHSVLSISDGKSVLFSHMIKVGGADFTRKICETFSVSKEEGEEMKFEKGLLQNPENQDLVFCLAPIVSSVRDEIMKHLWYWDSHGDEFGVKNTPVKKIIIFGSQATIPGLMDYFSQSIGMPVVLGSPWKNIFSLEKYIPEISAKKSVEFVTAVGLAVGGISSEAKK